MSYVFRTVLLTTLVTSIACGGADTDPNDAGGSGGAGGGGTGGSGALTYAEYQAATIDRWCQQILDCPIPRDDELGNRAVLKTPERCRAFYTATTARWINMTDLVDAVATGRVLFDGASAATCLAEHPFSCELLWTFDAACLSYLTGTIPLGGNCNRNEECTGSAYCVNNNNSCPGTCADKKAVGATCDSSIECDSNGGYAECDSSVTPSVCIVRLVRHGSALGEACGVQANGERVVCQGQLWCDGPFNGVGVCRAPIPVGSANTDADAPCEGLALQDSVTNTCQEVIVTDQIGGACDPVSGIPLHMCDPLANLICVAGSCELAGDGLENSRCVPGDLGDASCQLGFYCDRDTDVCLPLKASGMPCSSAQECEIDCDFGTNTCVDQYCGI